MGRGGRGKRRKWQFWKIFTEGLEKFPQAHVIRLYNEGKEKAGAVLYRQSFRKESRVHYSSSLREE